MQHGPRPSLSLSATLAVQILGSALLTGPSVLAPAVAPLLGFRPERVGLFVGVAYLAAMLSGLWSGRGVARLGAVRLCQVAMIACAAGAFAAIAGGTMALLASAVVIGGAYGVLNPSSSTILERHSPPARRGLFFSIKQTGVPIGVALAGLFFPWGLVAFGWQVSVVVAGVACAALAAALIPARLRLEPERDRSPAADAQWSAEPLNVPTSSGAHEPSDAAQGERVRAMDAGEPPAVGARTSTNGLAALRSVLRDAELRRLSLASLTFACTQLAFVTFLVSLLNLQLGHSLAWSAGVLAGAQVVSTVSRIAFGYVGDRWIEPRRLLGMLGLAMGASFIALALPDADTNPAWIVAAAIFCAATAMGWNGVYFAELARVAAQRADLATVAGASQFLTFAGSMSGPVLFAEIIRAGGTYGIAFVLLAVLPASAGVAMLRAKERGGAE